MRRNLSIYLDLMRTIAALGVVLSHAAGFIFPAIPDKIAGHGVACVALFFVLSGFVIRFVSVEKHEGNARKYAIARMSRIIPVAILSFVVTSLFDGIGRFYAPALYPEPSGAGLIAEIGDLLVSALYINQVWFEHSQFGGNGAFWSLGFEVPYYVLFGLILFLKGGRRIIAVVAWFILYGPNVLAYLPVWLIGVASYEFVRAKRYPDNVLAGVVMMLASVAGYWLFKHAVPMGLAPYEARTLSDITQPAVFFFVIGLLVALQIMGADCLLGKRDIFPKIVERSVRWIAGGSFTLYLCHMPIMMMIRAVYPSVNGSAAAGAVALFCTIATCYVLAECAERRKAAARRIFEAIVPHHRIAASNAS